MAMGVPILLGVEGEAAAIVTEAKAGLLFEPENADALAAAVKRLADDRGEAVALGENARRAARDKFDRRVLAERFLALLEQVARRDERCTAS